MSKLCLKDDLESVRSAPWTFADFGTANDIFNAQLYISRRPITTKCCVRHERNYYQEMSNTFTVSFRPLTEQ